MKVFFWWKQNTEALRKTFQFVGSEIRRRMATQWPGIATKRSQKNVSDDDVRCLGGRFYIRRIEFPCQMSTVNTSGRKIFLYPAENK